MKGTIITIGLAMFAIGSGLVSLSLLLLSGALNIIAILGEAIYQILSDTGDQ